MVHALLSYSKRPDLATDLETVVNQLSRALSRSQPVRRISVHSEAPPRAWRIADRFDEAELRTLVVNFQAGLSIMQLAAQYGISRSSIKRLLKAEGVSRR